MEKVKELRLCFCCLKPNHQLNSCFSKTICGVNNCVQKHNPLLHNQNIMQPSGSSTVNASIDRVSCHIDGQEDDVLFQIVPIKLYNNGKEVSIYAFVDDGANATMLDWEVARILGLQGTTDTLRLQWLHGQPVCEPTEIVNLFVSAIDDNQNKYEMKRVYLSKGLELPTQSIVKSRLIEKNPHLANLPINEYLCKKP